MENYGTTKILPTLILLIPETHIADYSYLNIIEWNLASIERELIELSNQPSEAASRMILDVWTRTRRFYETRGRYADGIKFASIFRQAAEKLSRKADAAWIGLKDDLWLRVLNGEQGEAIALGFEQALTEMGQLWEHGTTPDERRNGGIGLLTTYRYIVGYQRYLKGGFVLPKSKVNLTREKALKKCEDVLKILEKDDVFTDEHLGPIRSRIEQTAGNVALINGDANGALTHYNRASELLSMYAPKDDEHLAIVKCFQAQAHIALAGLAFNLREYRGARLFSAEFRKSKREATDNLAQAINLLHEASVHAGRADWQEGTARISEHMAQAFLLEGKVNLSIMFFEDSLHRYINLKNPKHVGRVEDLLNRAKLQDGPSSHRRSGCDILVVGRMREEIDTQRLLAIQEVCNGITLDNQPIHVRRVDELVDHAGGRITDALIDALWNSKVVIAILDGLSPNVLYEVGLAHGCGKPVVLCLSIDEDTTALPFDLKDYQIVRFGSLAEMSKRLVVPLLDELRITGHKVIGPLSTAKAQGKASPPNGSADD